MVRNDKYFAFRIYLSNTLHACFKPFNISFIFRIMALYSPVINIIKIRNFYPYL
jgi:hypothetical protein